MRDPDPDALRYAEHWEPVLLGPGRRSLDRIRAVPSTFLDVGAGTGALAAIAAARWPEARIICLDASTAMLSVGRERLARERPADDPARFGWLVADATAMPIEDASVDVAVTSFVLQMVDDRPAVLREILRVLRPGGVLGLVTWLSEELVLPADEAFAAVVRALGWAEPVAAFRPFRTTDYRTVAEACAEVSEAGFADVDAQADELRHSWTREEYLVFKERFDEPDLFESLADDERARLIEAVRARWASLPEAAFSVRGPLVSVVAHRPATG